MLIDKQWSNLDNSRPFDGTPVKVSAVGALAQLVEHLTFNQVVTGSTPVRPTIFSRLTHLFHYYLNLGSNRDYHGDEVWLSSWLAPWFFII